MLTSVACPESAAGSWVTFTSSAVNWLMHPLKVVPVFVVLLALMQLLPQPSNRRVFSLLVSLLILGYVAILSPVPSNLAGTVLEHQVPLDSGEKADAIVILGRGRKLNPSRATVAAHLWQSDRAPLIFASGIFDAPNLLASLKSQGIPDNALQGEDCSRTTYENAKFTAALLKPQGVQKILLITDSPHLLRSTLTFRGFGFRVIPIASSQIDTLPPTIKTRLVLREYLGLVSYGLLGRLSGPRDDLAQDTQTTTPSISASIPNKAMPEKPITEKPITEKPMIEGVMIERVRS